jgi:DNA-binding NtrC family response regulator
MDPIPDTAWALVLEDDPSVADVLKSTLARLGWPCLTVSGWTEGQDALSREGCALLIADQGLSEHFTGEAAISWSRAHLPSVRCVLVSGATRPPRFREDPPNQVFLDKPFGPEELRAALQRLELPCGEPIPRKRRR